MEHDCGDRVRRVVEHRLPASSCLRGEGRDECDAPTLAEISDFLARLAEKATITGAEPSNVAGQPAYTVSISPKRTVACSARLQLAWDAPHGVPLRVAVYAQGSSSPVLELAATQSPTDTSRMRREHLAARRREGRRPRVIVRRRPGTTDNAKPVSGLAPYQAAVDFPVTAPDTLVGLPRKDVRLVGGRTVVAVYGQGLGAILLVEKQVRPGLGERERPRALEPADRRARRRHRTRARDAARDNRPVAARGGRLRPRRFSSAAAAEAAARSLK